MPKVSKRTWANADGSESSRWQVRYRDQWGKRRSKEFARKRDAESFASTIERQVRDGLHVHDRDAITVAKAADEWLAACQRGRDGRDPVEVTTLATYRGHVEHYVKPALGGVLVNKLTTPHVRKFRNGLVDRGLSSVTIRKVLTSLKGVLGEAVASGYAGTNPAAGVTQRRSARHDEEPVEMPSHEDVRAMLETSRAWRHEPPRLDKVRANGRRTTQPRFSAERTMYLDTLLRTAVLTGLRLSELRGLPWANVDLEEGTITVAQRADRLGQIGPPKSAAGWRTLAIPQALVDDLREWSHVCPDSELGLVFPTATGRIEDGGNIRKRLYGPLQVAAGVCEAPAEGEGAPRPRYSLHALRHYRASILIGSGADPTEVQRELGHHSAAFTLDRYAKWFKGQRSDDRRRERAEAIAGDVLGAA
jgi:integrase